MHKNSMQVLLISSFTSFVFVNASSKSLVEVNRQVKMQQHWKCFLASGAETRKQQVEIGMLPRVVFVGETPHVTIESRMANHKTQALSVAVIHNGKLDWSAAWGQLQVDGARAACDSLFQAGSLAKPVSLLAALHMKQKGLIDFDKNIETYLSSYHLPAGPQTDANPVTFRNLFAHTAGITPGGYSGYTQGQSLPTDQQIVRAEAPSNSPKVEVVNAPNSSLNYSGGGYTIIEIALQDLWHKPFEQIMREWVISPVGMRQADFTQPLPRSSHSHTALGYLADGSPVPGGWHNHPEQAAAGLWATASDLATFLIEIRQGYLGKSKVFTQASIREMLTKPIDGHSYGFRLIGKGDDLFITHYGGTIGYRAGMTLNLRTGDGAVYLTNSDNGADLGIEFFNAVSRVYDWPAFRETQVKRGAQTIEVLKSLVGRYVFVEQNWKLSVVYENDALTLVFPNGDHYAMTPILGIPREFIHSNTGVRASFAGEGSNMRIQLYGQTGQRNMSDD